MATVNITDQEWEQISEKLEREGFCYGHGQTDRGFSVFVVYGQTLDQFVRYVIDLAALRLAEAGAENTARSIQQSLPVIPVVLDSTNPMN